MSSTWKCGTAYHLTRETSGVSSMSRLDVRLRNGGMWHAAGGRIAPDVNARYRNVAIGISGHGYPCSTETMKNGLP